MTALSTQCQMYSPPVQNAMGGANLHTPPSIFQHMMGQQTGSQQSESWMQMSQVSSVSIPYTIQSRQKRKLMAPDLLDTRQTKQFITEEKMAAHFKDLHISSNYQPQSPVPSTSTSTVDAQPSTTRELNMELEMEAASVEADQVKPGHPRLVLSEELKQMQQDLILPTSLLSKLKRPSMALVLWEPPSKHLRILPAGDTPSPVPGVSDDNNNNNNNNNNEAIPDLNQTLSGNMLVFEPMEL